MWDRLIIYYENKLMKLFIHTSIDINSVMIKHVKTCAIKMLRGGGNTKKEKEVQEIEK